MREIGRHGDHGGLAGVDAGRVPQEDPRLSFLALVHHAVQSGRELQDRRRSGPAVLCRDVMSVLWPGLLWQPARVHDLHEHVQPSTAHAEGDRERRGLPRVALQLSLLDAAAAPPDLMHRQDPARRLGRCSRRGLR